MFASSNQTKTKNKMKKFIFNTTNVEFTAYLWEKPFLSKEHGYLLRNGINTFIGAFSSKELAWKLGKGGYLLEKDGYFFQVSENNPIYIEMLAAGFKNPVA
jgi:hypothetical protein